MKRSKFFSFSTLLLLLFLAVGTVQPLSAQPQGPRPGCGRGEGPRPGQPFDLQKFQKELSAHITEKAGLTADEAERFFPVFFQLKAEQRSLMHKKEKAIRVAANRPGITESECQKVIRQLNAIDSKLQKVEDDYAKRLIKIVGAKKYLKTLQADRSFGRDVFRRMTSGQQGKR
ncbi:MAG: hypothetical protein ACI3YC_05875 [Alloprevotella sp.]